MRFNVPDARQFIAEVDESLENDLARRDDFPPPSEQVLLAVIDFLREDLLDACDEVENLRIMVKDRQSKIDWLTGCSYDTVDKVTRG